MLIQITELKSRVVEGVQKLGYTDTDANIIAEVLMYAELRGNNQGITKIATGGVPKASETQPLTVTKENLCGIQLSGGHTMVATYQAAEHAVRLAKQHGVGIACSNQTFSSSGAIGYFSRQIAKQGYIGFVCVGNGSFAFVAPTGSAEPKLGTNPFSYAFPYAGGEVVFDNATSAAAYFGIVEAKLKGEALPEHIGFDASGQPSTDPNAVLDGSVATFAGHKGFGLSLFVQLLGSAFSSAGIPGHHEEDGAGTFVLAIDPGLLADRDMFMTRSTELIEHIRSAKPLPEQTVFLPGERGDARAKAAEQSGNIDIDEAIWNELMTFVKAAA